MFFVNIGIIVGFLIQVGLYVNDRCSQPYFASGFCLCVGAIGSMVFGYSMVWGTIQLVGLFIGAWQATTWLRRKQKA